MGWDDKEGSVAANTEESGIDGAEVGGGGITIALVASTLALNKDVATVANTLQQNRLK